MITFFGITAILAYFVVYVGLIGHLFVDLDKGWLAATVGVIGLAAPISFMIAADNARPTLDILKKGEWECVKTETYTTWIMASKVMVPQTNTRCIEYRRK